MTLTLPRYSTHATKHLVPSRPNRKCNRCHFPPLPPCCPTWLAPGRLVVPGPVHQPEAVRRPLVPVRAKF